MSDQQRFLIFGGTGGIGSALATRLHRRGARLVISARGAERGEAMARSLDAAFVAGDVRDDGVVDGAFAQAIDRLGGLDGVALAVGSILLKPAHLLRDEEWEDTLALNLTSAFRVVRAAAKRMGKTGGSVVLFSTTAALHGLPNHEAIAAAKAGVDGLVRSAAATYASRGLRFNAVAPGLVETPLAARITGSERARETSLRMHPLKRLGAPDDIARVAEWLLTDDSSWVTGQTVAVDGGISTVASP
ncbi:MAG: SDR family NAD(P)-dependent oxidoreductase [Sandaracinaceae bacterium]